MIIATLWVAQNYQSSSVIRHRVTNNKISGVQQWRCTQVKSITVSGPKLRIRRTPRHREWSQDATVSTSSLNVPARRSYKKDAARQGSHSKFEICSTVQLILTPFEHCRHSAKTFVGPETVVVVRRAVEANRFSRLSCAMFTLP